MPGTRLPLLFALWTLFAPGAYAATTQELYVDRCAMCHLPGIAGAPKVGDQAEWARRVRAGMNQLYRNALEGMPNTAMMAKGGHTDLGDGEFRAIVDLMLAAARLTPAMLEAAARYDRRNISNRDFIRLDVNFDGALARDELAADPVLLKNFARFDADRDGSLSVAEYESAEAALERERRAVTADDYTLVTAIRAALKGLKGVDPQYVKIESSNGLVVLTGIVDEAADALRAQNAVKRIPGIQKLDNRLVSGHQIGWD
jgi:cytochrome c5